MSKPRKSRRRSSTKRSRRSSTKKDVSAKSLSDLVKHGLIRKSWYDSYKDRNNYKMNPITIPKRVLTMTKKQRTERLTKIYDAMYSYQMSNYRYIWERFTYQCKKDVMELEYPIQDPPKPGKYAHCKKIRIDEPIPMTSMNMLAYVRKQIGGPLYLTYYIDSFDRNPDVIRIDS